MENGIPGFEIRGFFLPLIKGDAAGVGGPAAPAWPAFHGFDVSEELDHCLLEPASRAEGVVSCNWP